MKMKAALLIECGMKAPYAESRPLRIEEVELDPPRENEVLVKIGGGGLCHSDLSVINGDRPRAVPLAMGHEGAGEVVVIGPGIRDVKAGDHVVLQFSPGCGRCRRCLEGPSQVCEIAAVARDGGDMCGGSDRKSGGEGMRGEGGVGAGGCRVMKKKTK